LSLVERAAQRLDELKRAGEREQGSPPNALVGEGTAPSVIERAVQRAATPPIRREETRESSLSAVATTRERVASTPRAQSDPQRAKLPRPPAPAPSPSSDPSARHVQLDLRKLVQLGFLDPNEPESAVANEFRRIKRPLIQAVQGKLAAPVANASRILVTSSLPGEGKTFIALNLALSLAMERDSTVLLVDADTTRRSLSQLIGIDARPGLLDLLSGELDLEPALLSTNVDRLTLLPAGARRRHATELLASESMVQLVESLTARYKDRILIFDAPPLLGAPEPAVLASHMGQIIVVVEADKTTQKTLKAALTAIESCPLVTTILNKTTATESNYYYYSA
jgi:receptor protein-tyrosine kinase